MWLTHTPNCVAGIRTRYVSVKPPGRLRKRNEYRQYHNIPPLLNLLSTFLAFLALGYDIILIPFPLVYSRFWPRTQINYSLLEKISNVLYVAFIPPPLFMEKKKPTRGGGILHDIDDTG